MKINKWTLGLAAAGVVSLSSVVQAEEAAHQVLTAVSSTTLSGYVSTSAIWNMGTSRAVGPFRAATYGGAAKQDSFNLDVVNLTVSKNLDEGEWSAGYKAELLFGPDATTFGTGGAGQAIKQAYVQLRAPVGNGLDFKVGVWDTPIGYEVFNSGDNPNYSRSYGYGLEPTTYTGILASYKAADFLSLWAGIANAANPLAGVGIGGTGGASISNIESEKAYMIGFTATAPDSLGFMSGSTLSAGGIYHAGANGGTVASNDGHIYNFYIGATMKTGVEGLLAGASMDYQGRDAAVGGSGSYYANAYAVYLSFQVSEKLKSAFRAEYASGSSTVTAGSALPFGNAAKFAAGNNVEVMSFTGTVDYKLWENVISRVELRWDSDVSGGPKLFGNSDKNDISLALNIIYKF
jgi:hypothetical protein